MFGQAAATSAQVGQRRAQDQQHRVVEQRLAVGQWVYMREERSEHKLTHRFVGPFRVVARTEGSEGGNYCVADKHGTRLERSWPRDKLFLVGSPTSFSRRQAQLYCSEDWDFARAACAEVQAGPLPSSAGAGPQVFVVERILDRRPASGNGNHRKEAQVLIKWSGFSEPQWIPESDVLADDLAPLLRAWRVSAALERGEGPARARLRRVVPGVDVLSQ